MPQPSFPIRRLALALLGAATAVLGAASTLTAGETLPPGFSASTVVGGLVDPVGIAPAADGRIFVAEKRGTVRVVADGAILPGFFVDLRDEVNGAWDRGLLGIALDPGFAANRRVYLLYVVDPDLAPPDDDPSIGTFSRLVRYTGTAASDGAIADPASRLVLIGAMPSEGIPVCEPSHAIGTLRFANDGTLFVGAGDGAHFDTVDAGGLDPECFGPGLFDPLEDIGAYRAQYLGSLAGKILRVDPATGLGLPTNPHWNGDGAAARSRVWVNGLRNPFRFAVDPASPGTGELAIGDVGWYTYEELNLATGGENFGWPCREGPGPTPVYPGVQPPHSGCASIETPTNPGPLTAPAAWWHHGNAALSRPAGSTGTCTGGTVYLDNACWPAPWGDAIYQADHIFGWIRALERDRSGAIVAAHLLTPNAAGPTDLAIDPLTGDLLYVAYDDDMIRRIRFDAVGTTGDLDGDCLVTFADLVALLAAWGPCPAPPADCPADLDGDGSVGFDDLVVVLANWS